MLSAFIQKSAGAQVTAGGGGVAHGLSLSIRSVWTESTDEEPTVGMMDLALGAAPLAGGALLGAIAGNLKPPDVRAAIKADIDLLDRIPAEQTERRAELQRTIDMRIDELIGAIDRGRQLKSTAMGYAFNREGRLRDILVFILAVLFSIIWWNLKHSRPGWLPMFIALIIFTALAGWYALRGLVRALTPARRRKKTDAAR